MKKKMNYSIALDIGNTSVGWAVIDENNNLLKHRGRNMWGVRLFEEGQTAATRRNFRATRRRLLRRRQRLDLLQELLAQDVLAKDESFFMKLKESFLVKGNGNKIYNLFNDSDFTDQNFYDKYPTIYHLRYKLITNKEKEDIRLVYLALHHIIKYRGNFLYEGQTFNIQDSTIITDLENLLEYLK
ncbi:MAG: type II CRISPR RNA-guided endonuclease Cas9, partial [Acholeplasmataceae bacterium]|nr:type II CRISPR RNA-guided endonuclease Cas9 [Acholeplasmataceae bacterium]